MSSKMERTGDVTPIFITTDVLTATTIEFSDDGDMLLLFPSTWTLATLSWFVYHSDADEWVEIVDASGVATNQSAAPSSAMQVPPAVFAAHDVRVICDEAANAAIIVEAMSKS